MYINSQQMDSVSLYSEARTEYMKQLSIWIIPPLVEFFRKEYNTILEKEGKRTMAVFQKYCAEVPLWNQDIIDIHIGVILDSCRCDYIEELMTAVFIAHTKMLTAIRVNSRQKKLQITLPKLDHFLHRVFIECARAFWKAPFLFSDELTPIERQKNILQAEAMCTEALSGAVRSLLPVKSILRDYLEDDEAEITEEVDEEEKPVLPKKPSTLKKSIAVEEAEQVVEDKASVTEEKVPVVVTEEKVPVVVTEEKVPVVVTEEKVPVVVKEEKVPVVVKEEKVPVVVTEEKAPVADVKAPVIVLDVNTNTIPTIPDVSNSLIPQDTKQKTPIVVEKLDSSPVILNPTPSEEKSINIPSKQTVDIEKANETKLTFDTEPAVHFTPYDTVFDETSSNISEIRYTPKISVEDKPSWDNAPRLTIGTSSSPLEASGVVDLEGDVDTPLSTLDFEVLN